MKLLFRWINKLLCGWNVGLYFRPRIRYEGKKCLPERIGQRRPDLQDRNAILPHFPQSPGGLVIGGMSLQHDPIQCPCAGDQFSRIASVV